jgi:8-amino-7-oxononanoate synthase
MNDSADREPLGWIGRQLRQLERDGLRRHLTDYTGRQGTRVVLGGRELVNFGSNDYLGLAADPRLAQAVAEAAEKIGWGSGASPLVCGHAGLHAELETRLAEFEGCEAALLFPSGFAANVGAITALVGRDDAIYGDAKNHASIIDGCRLSRAEVHIYRHGDVEHLADLLRDSGRYRRRLIVTDTLFSMDGDLAPLAEIVPLAERHRAMLMVDEAHATGVFGPHGRGVAEMLGMEQGVHVRVGTLSKALGGAGGFVAGSRPLIDWLANRARSYVFSTAQPAAACAASLAALQIVADEPERRRRLLARAETFRGQLRALGWSVGASASQIVPIFVGPPDATMRLAACLRERGLFVPGIRPPSVPAGESLLRVSLGHGHTEEDVDRLLDALGKRSLC